MNQKDLRDGKTSGARSTSGPATPGPEHVERLLRAGQLTEVCSLVSDINTSSLDDTAFVRLWSCHGAALFERGDVIGAIATLRQAQERAVGGASELEAGVALSLFARESQFQSPEQTVGTLTQVRQLATGCRDTAPLGGLHLVVARLEACRGHFVNARRHVDLSRQLFARSRQPTNRCLVDLVDSGLEAYSGKIRTRCFSCAHWVTRRLG